MEEDNFKKQSVLAHLEDLRWHLARSAVAMFIGFFIAFINKSFILIELFLHVMKTHSRLMFFYVIYGFYHLSTQIFLEFCWR